MSPIDKTPQFPVGIGFVGGEARIDFQEVLNTVTVISAVLCLAILQHRAEPEGACAEPLQISEVLADALERASLESGKGLVPCSARRSGRIVEAVHQEEINPTVAPIFRRGKRNLDFDILPIDRDMTDGSRAGGREYLRYVRAKYGVCHGFPRYSD